MQADCPEDPPAVRLPFSRFYLARAGDRRPGRISTHHGGLL